MPRKQQGTKHPRRAPWLTNNEILKVTTRSLKKSGVIKISSPQNMEKLRREIISRLLNLVVKNALDNARITEKKARAEIQKALAEAYSKTPWEKVALINFDEATQTRISKHLGPTEKEDLLKKTRFGVAAHKRMIEEKALKRLERIIARN